MKPKMSEPLLREADFDEDHLHDQDMPEKETKMKPNYGTFSNSFLNTNRWPKISLPFLWISSKMTLATPSIQIQINSENETDYSDLEDPGPEHDVDDEHVNATVLDSGDSHLEADREIPYRCVHDDSLPFDDIDRRVLIPGERIVVKITDVDRYPTPQLLNPNLYVIELQHGPYTWTIKKRYHHFRELHDSLLLYKASMKIPVPTKRLKERRRTFRKSSLKNKELPRLPRRLDALVTAPQLARRMVQLEKYLQNLLSNQIYRAHQHTLEFLEVSHLSFINELGEKGKEGAVKKRSGGHRIPLGCCTRCCGGCYCEWAGHWNKRWLITKESYVGYMRPKDGRLCCVVLMDEDFRVSSGLIHTGVHHGLLVTNMTRNLLLKCWTRRKAKEWADYISTLAEKCEYTKRNRYKSFAPVRSESYANWYIDGADYFNAVADSLESAKEEIFITDWWLSPEIYMKRPVTEGNKWRLDQILRRKAESGVKIFVLLYKEVEMALGLKSSYSKLTLRKLHPSIKVMRHPDHVPGGVLLWAHHEKTVVIDQNIAFLGGIDLCYGRWDDFTHRLVDVGSALPTKQSSFTDLTQGALRKFPSTPDHLNTAADSNFNSLQLNIHRKTSFGRLSNTNLEKVEKGFDEIDSVPVGQSNVLAVPKLVTCRSSVDADLDKLGVQGNAKLWYGKDYTNFIAKDFVDLDRPFQDFIDRTTTPRMPWHDIGAVVYGVAARDVSRHFIQRWNATKLEKAKENTYIPLVIPKSTKNVHIPKKVKEGAVPCSCQILRSVSTWSAGIKHTENSIYWAYLDAIKEAKHYIYIENQFFISCHDDRDVFNKIADALYDRIMQAHRAKHKFRVFVVLPLLPAFEGEIGETGGSSILAITHWNYKSICRGGNSLLERLQRDVDQPEEYISFCGLRTYSELDGQPVSELVYVHSKLMIVDDNTVIIGSANINDRSLLGKRDSEMAVIVNDTNTVMSKMNGKDYKAGLYASGLRKHLFKEHLGLMTNPDLNIDITDPVSDTFFKEVWQQTAQHNTEIYDKVFHCIPCDCVTSFDELKQYKSKEPLCTSSPGDAYNELAKVKGFLVKMPLEFLCLENLEPSIATQEGMMPTKLWT